jgi:hypothetical protein
MTTERSEFFAVGSFGFVTCRICGAAVSMNEGTTAADLHVRHHEAMADAFRLLRSNEGRSTPLAVLGEAVEAHEI